MAVLIEGISVVVRCKAIFQSYEGGQSAFMLDVPNNTLCSDGELAAVSFMVPAGAKSYVDLLENKGLRYFDGKAAVDIVVIDQNEGIRAPCDWAQVGTTEWNNRDHCLVTVCQLVPTVVDKIVAPVGWTYDNSLTARGRYVPGHDIPSSLTMVGSEGGVDVFVDEETGEKLYVRRS